MTRIIAINATDPTHLAEVMEAMRELGTPVIRAVWMEVYGAWVALEGSHRLAAAAELGIFPEIEQVQYDEVTPLEDLGCDDSGDGFTLADICDGAYDSSRPCFTFQD